MLILLYPLVMSKVSYGKIHHFYSWEKPLFLWPFSMAMLNYQRVSPVFSFGFWSSLEKGSDHPLEISTVFDGWCATSTCTVPLFWRGFFVGISWTMSSYLKVYGMTAMGVTINEDLTFTDKNQSWWFMFIDKMVVTSIFTHQAYLVISDCWSVMSWLSWLLQMFSTIFGKKDENRRDPGTFFPGVSPRMLYQPPARHQLWETLDPDRMGQSYPADLMGCLKIGYPGYPKIPWLISKSHIFPSKSKEFYGYTGHAQFYDTPKYRMMRYPMISDYVPVS